MAHFHDVLFGAIVFATYAGIYFWFPKMTGRMIGCPGMGEAVTGKVGQEHLPDSDPRNR